MSEWEKRNDPRLAQWRSDAKGMEISGDLAGAQILYQKMLLLAQSPGATVTALSTKAMLTDAQQGYEWISRKIGPLPTPVAMGSGAGVPAATPATAPSDTPPPSQQIATAIPAPDPSLPSGPAPAPPAGSPTPPAPIVAPVAPPAPPPPVAETAANFEPLHHDQLMKMAADADALEKQQQPVAALATLQTMLDMVAPHRATLSAPDLKSAVAAADASRQRLAVATRNSPDAAAITARSFLAAGLKAEQDNKWRTALDMLSDSAELIGPTLRPVQRYRDPLYLTALDAEAVAAVNLKQTQRANQLFGDDEPLGRASLPINAPSRNLIWNRAVNDLNQKTNILRAVKTLHDYMNMDSHQDPDEPLLNLLGTVLYVGDQSNPPDRRILDDAIGFYSQRSTDLEKTHPGQRRWGIQWLSEDDAKTQFDAYNKSIDSYQESLRLKTAAEKHAKDQQDGHRSNPQRVTQKEVDTAKAAAVAAAAAVKSAHDAIPNAPWLKDVQTAVPAISPALLAYVPAPTTAPTTAPAAALPLAPGAGSALPAVNSSAMPADTGSSMSPAGAPPAPPGGAAGTTPAASAAPAGSIIPPPAPEVRYAAAFPIDATHLVTASDPLGTATQVTVDDTRGGIIPAHVVATSGKLALLEVNPADAGGPLKYFSLATDFTGGPVQCAAIPQANLFIPTVALLATDAPAPSKTAWWTSMTDHPRLPGSPLLDAQNEVIGVEVASRDDARQRIPSITLDELRKFLESNHVVPALASSGGDPNVVSQVAAQAE